MANTYYDSTLSDNEIEAVLETIDGLIVPSNNGKILYVDNGQIKAKVPDSGVVLESLSVTENGDYTPGVGVDGFDEVHVNVSGGGSTLITKSITQNGTYNASSYNADGYSQVVVNVSGGSTGPLQYLTPYAENITSGFVSGGTWYYSTAYNNLNTTVFAVEARKKYLFLVGKSTERLRAMFTTQDITIATSNIQGDTLVDENSAIAYQAFDFSAIVNGFVAIYVGGQPRKVYGFLGELP